MTGMCACGQPLHYANPATKAGIEKLIAQLGEHINVFCEGKTYKVPRHFIALHGIKGSELPQLAEKYGFEVVLT